jgi:hypothetical protein
MTADFLLTIEVCGITHRLATRARIVDGHPYRPELDPGLEVALSSPEDVTVRVVSPALWQWAEELDTATAELHLLTDDGSQLITTGRVVAPVYGSRLEAIGLTITRDVAGVTRGSQVPAETRRVDATTWPVGAGEVGTEGATYPVIFGYPGFVGTGLDPVPCVPLPIAELTGTAATTYMLVSEDARAEITSIRVRLVDREDQPEFDQDVSSLVDNLGQVVLVSDCSTGGATSIPDAPTAGLLAGFSDAGGGGVARSMYDAIRYLLERWGAGSVDWTRLSDARDILEPLLVDSYVISPIDDPWVLIDSWLQWLPVVVRVGERGRYLVPKRHVHDPSRVVGDLLGATRVGVVSRDGPPENEVVIQFRQDPQIGWRDQVAVVGSILDFRPAEEPDPTRVIEIDVARRSYSRYNRRPGPRIPVDWTWDVGTALAVAGHVLDRRALPCRLVSYDVPLATAARWREGDEVLVTDDDLGWVQEPAIIESPPRLTLEQARVMLRIPGA